MDARDFLPRSADLDSLAEAAKRCQGCELYRDATQTVFGSGPPHARVVFVGEQPGDIEDRRGEPFVGPAGQLLDRALDESGIDRDDAYVTNAVKHFRFTQQSGPRRLHKTPERQHITACRPWLSAELALLNPEVVVALGATAVMSLLGPDYRVTRDRGKLLPFEVPTNVEETATHTSHALITTHPSAILRTPPEQRDAAYEAFLSDLRTVAATLT